MIKEPQFSTELKVLAGEWLTYCAISRYFRDLFEEEMYDFSEFSLDLSLEEKFEKCPIYVNYDALFGDAYLFLQEMGITRARSSGIDVAECRYSKIPEKIRANIHKSDYSVSYAFILIAGYHSVYLREKESDYFFIEEKCIPLFKALQQEGFCRQNDDRHYWTSKLRPYLEYKNIWKKVEIISEEEKLLSTLSDDIKAKLDLCAEAKDLISACAVLTSLTNTRLGVAKKLLENHMYPKIWGKSEEKQNNIFKWYGPA